MLVSRIIIVGALFYGVLWIADFMSDAIIVGTAEVVDGDTLLLQGRQVDLFAVDALEQDQVCELAGEQWPCGNLATQTLKQLTSAKTVSCRPMSDLDQEPVIARCYAGLTDDLAQQMVAAGWAFAAPMTHDYKADQDKARNAASGAWTSRFAAPWEVAAKKEKSS